MPIETLDDIVDEVMNRFGIYGAHDHDRDDSGDTCPCHCRCCESSSLRGRIIAAVDVEQRLARQNGVGQNTADNTARDAMCRLIDARRFAGTRSMVFMREADVILREYRDTQTPVA